jgi:hypothetical protein
MLLNASQRQEALVVTPWLLPSLGGRVCETLHPEAQLQDAVAVGMMGPFQAAASVKLMARVAAQGKKETAPSADDQQQSQVGASMQG